MAQRLGIWRPRNATAWVLWPLSMLYGALVALRQSLYQAGWLRTRRAARPVIVVGNVIAGGAGKTPVTMALVTALKHRGWRPGVISRGYGRSTRDCQEVTPESPASAVGDEPALIARTCAVPVFVATERLQAAEALLERHPEIDVLVCDDGLQHLALARDFEICVFNAHGVGNGWLLPAGPLREPWPRPVDAVLHTGPAPGGPAPAFALQRQIAPWAVGSDGRRVPLRALQATPVHAVAGIARPQDFFDMLRDQGLVLESMESLPDHYDFDSWSRLSDKGLSLVCTEKDALKLWRRHPEALAVPLQVTLPSRLIDAIEERLRASPQPLSSPTA